MEATIKDEPLEVLVPFVNAPENLNPHFKMEEIFQESDGCPSAGSFKQELHLAARGPIKAEPLDAPHDARTWKHQDSKEPLTELVPYHFKTEPIWQEEEGGSAAGSLKEESQLLTGALTSIQRHHYMDSMSPVFIHEEQKPFTQPYPVMKECRVLLKDIKVNTGASRRDHVSSHHQGDSELAVLGYHSSTQPAHGTGMSPSHGTTLKLETAGADFYSEEAGCSIDPEIPGLSHEEEEVFECNMCQVQFRLKNHLKEHIRKHINGGKLHCKWSNMQCSSFSNPSRHKVVHTGGKPLKREVGRKQVALSSNLKRPTRVHIGAKTFMCELCNKQFTASIHLTRHTRVHTGEKPFKCEVCRKHFREYVSLSRHTSIHRCTGEKRYKCDMCSKEFARSVNLAMHSVKCVGNI